MIWEPQLLVGAAQKAAHEVIVQNHYAHCIPSGKNLVVSFGPALVLFAITTLDEVDEWYWSRRVRMDMETGT